tara:strand:- start:6051 stop:6548 length:498 start_codon:yes stop_codon:yes gene_type:complete
MSSKKPRVNFARIRDNRLKQQQEADAPPPLPKDASDLYADSGPPDVPVSQPIKSQPVAEPASSPQRPEPSIAPAPTQPVKTKREAGVDESDMPNRVEARVSDAELQVIKQVVRKEKGRRSKATGEPSSFNRQDLVREGLLAICRDLEPEFDKKVRTMTAALKQVE